MRQITLSLLALVLLCVSCSKNKEACLKATTNFMEAVKNNDHNKMAQIYPNVNNLTQFYKVDSYEIKDIKKGDDDKFTVSVNTTFTNGFGAKKDNRLKLFLYKSDDMPTYSISDSEGMTDFTENPLYKFASRTGCLTGKETTDQQKAKNLMLAIPLAAFLKEKELEYLRANVTVTSWSWERSYYGNSAFGRGIVRNNTNTSIYRTQYKINYMNKNGDIITTDTGYLVATAVPAYQSTSFSFYSNYVGNATQATIELVFDEDWLLRGTLEADTYQGNEYERFQRGDLVNF